jgi:hypothetical protein
LLDFYGLALPCSGGSLSFFDPAGFVFPIRPNGA